MNRTFMLLLTMLATILPAAAAFAQETPPSKVEIAWNRYYTYAEIAEFVLRFGEAYPDLVTVEEIGKSLQGRPLYVATVTAPDGPAPSEKPAIWIDGNVHGNEVQASEVVLYTLWYLTRGYESNDEITRLLRDYTFHLMPSVNPDGRAYWFDEANTSSTSRGNQRPVDSDHDGLFDEDGPDDLDGDGHITTMWKADPNGRWIRSQTDPRVFERVPADKKGAWTWLGYEGIDNDGDGRINEDGPGGDDMNRNWPSDWQPTYVQGGAGPYPLSAPETSAVAQYILARPNIAASQSYHNTGGMILRGPGAHYRENEYSRGDVRVYDEIANIGVEMLPYYRSLIIHRDLYTVHGGFVNWMGEGLGVISFTNEMMTTARYFQRDVRRPDDEQTWIWRDRLVFGDVFSDYTTYDHPKYGEVLIGGPNKWASRTTPTFMLEEECHRNFAFTMLHADQMPLLTLDRVEVQRMDRGLWRVTFEIRNEKLIPTRTGRMRDKGIGAPDILNFSDRGGARVVASGRLSSWFDEEMTPVEHEPARIVVDEGISGRNGRIFQLLVAGPEGAVLRGVYDAEKALNLPVEIELRETE